jgi:hypothetical protein
MERGDAGAGAAGTSPPAEGVVRVETGALEVRRRYALQLFVGFLGWVLAAALIVYLASDAGQISIRIAMFLIVVAAIVAFTAALVAVEVRPRLILAREVERPPVEVDYTHDALGRSMDVEGARERRGELTIEEVGGVRRYRTVGAVTE